jgi:hypothetical protein
MIFFFAGHGQRVRAEVRNDYELNDREVEVICPVDLGPTTAEEKYVHGIPDYVLLGLLKQLAQKKGPNIVRMLCFSPTCLTSFTTDCDFGFLLFWRNGPESWNRAHSPKI